MELKPVKSSNVKALGYDEATQELQAEFNSGSVFAYDSVPRELFDELIARDGDGLGKVFHAKVVKGKFKFKKIK